MCRRRKLTAGTWSQSTKVAKTCSFNLVVCDGIREAGPNEAVNAVGEISLSGEACGCIIWEHRSNRPWNGFSDAHDISVALPSMHFGGNICIWARLGTWLTIDATFEL